MVNNYWKQAADWLLVYLLQQHYKQKLRPVSNCENQLQNEGIEYSRVLLYSYNTITLFSTLSIYLCFIHLLMYSRLL